MGFLFDLRGRPRYKGALAAKGEKWTRVDLFVSTQNPGITASIPVNNKNLAIEGVCGFDIDLSTSSKFLECIKYLLTLAITRPLNSLQQGIRRVIDCDFTQFGIDGGPALIRSPASAMAASRAFTTGQARPVADASISCMSGVEDPAPMTLHLKLSYR
jgi:hypothetical protein